MSRLCAGDGGSYFVRGLCVFLKRVTSESRLPILKETLTLKSPDEVDTVVWNPGMNSENASETLYRKIKCSSMDVDEPCYEVQLVLPKAEGTSKRRVL